MNRYWTMLLSGCTLVGAPLAAQQGPLVTTGKIPAVYTTAQAEEGQEIYLGRCRACHTPTAHAATFGKAFGGQALAEPFRYISENMPKDSPGALSERETIAVITYFLRLLGYPPGNRMLEYDSLSSMRLDTLAVPSTPAVEEKKP